MTFPSSQIPSPSIARPARLRAAAGFTIPELLVVMGVIAVLIAIILSALAGARSTAHMADSMSRLRQIATFMASYSSENREVILPSQFDYTASATDPASPYPVKVRSDAALGPLRYQGTWTDILWVFSSLNKNHTAAAGGAPEQYLYDSPDGDYYRAHGDVSSNPLRAAGANTRDHYADGGAPGTGAKPFGTGAFEGGLPGFWAGNDFFNARPDAPPDSRGNPTPANGRWYVTGQIKAPERSMYLIDSVAGEIIEPDGAPGGPWEHLTAFAQQTLDPNDPPVTGGVADDGVVGFDVDFRYNNNCLMLFLDGHSRAQAPWRTLDELEGRSVSAVAEHRAVKPKVRDLDKR